VTTSTLPLETELLALPAHDRNSGIVVRHYGLDGKGGANFQAIGREVGLSRERVRQIVSEADPRWYFRSGGLPALERVIGIVTTSLPAPAASVETRLRAEGVTAQLFRLEGIIEIAALLQCKAPFRVTRLKGKRFVVGHEFPRFQDIVSTARRSVRRHGMALLTECLPQDRKARYGQRESALLEEVLSAQKDFRWLDRQAGWFWLSDVRMNRVVNRIRKMFAVADSLEIAEIRAGLARMGDPPAPDAILLEFCRQMPELSVEGETVRARTEISAGKVLNPTERAIFRLLSENNGCLSNAELICGTRALGMKRPSFYQCVTWSPIVSRYKRGYYRLIGSAHTGAVAAS
jgi:hypothetical protein